ncbi:hypothetical protein [Cupriavidus sp. USMAHM13]|uniref:hypothetical protein n=1 Tax=Cupriavidus sp. USMAHM13 TaxID=1389192 RepID=UPI0012E9F810|nr:hypothetical protein [Cupriavidus sp. USMAHM13]
MKKEEGRAMSARRCRGKHSADAGEKCCIGNHREAWIKVAQDANQRLKLARCQITQLLDR